MKILLASDHAGFEMKNAVKACLAGAGYDIEDFGAHEYKKDDDYDDFIEPLAKKISEHPEGVKGVIFGGSGQGEAMSANRFKGVRAAVYYGGGDSILKLSRSHNDANVLSIGARFVDIEEVCDMVRLWLESPFLGEDRHIRRIKKLDEFQ
jgi:ribose 5-phosphate isomerase B